MQNTQDAGIDVGHLRREDGFDDVLAPLVIPFGHQYCVGRIGPGDAQRHEQLHLIVVPMRGSQHAVPAQPGLQHAHGTVQGAQGQGQVVLQNRRQALAVIFQNVALVDLEFVAVIEDQTAGIVDVGGNIR